MQAFLYGYYSTKSAGFQCYHYRIMAVMSYLSPALFSFEISLILRALTGKTGRHILNDIAPKSYIFPEAVLLSPKAAALLPGPESPA